MSSKIGSVIHVSNNNIPLKISFDIKNDNELVGTCQITIETIFLQVGFVDDHGNNFSFKPHKENETKDLALVSQTDISANRLGLGEEVIIKVEKGSDSIDAETYDEISYPESAYSNDEIAQGSSTFPTKAQNNVSKSDKPFECQVCGKSFTRREHLKVHVITHTDEKPFECKVCGRMFSRKDYLRGHLKTHEGAKPFKCETCGNEFTRKASLEVHTRIHTGNMPFKCEVCGKSFSLKQTLTKHTRTHTGEKPFECKVCGKNFPRKDNLNIHFKRVHCKVTEKQN